MPALKFLYDDGTIFAVEKPAGLHSVQGGEDGGASVADILLAQEPSLAGVGRRPGDAGLVQRLDLDTSGALLGARDPMAWEKLYASIAAGALKKSYVAVVEGAAPQIFGCTTYIGSPYRRSTKVRVYERTPPKGHRALEGTTEYHLISRHPTLSVSLVRADASPARRHQVRAHAAHLGYPLVGDKLYGATSALNELCPEARDFFLHSWRIEFTHPVSGEHVTITSSIETLLVWPRELLPAS